MKILVILACVLLTSNAFAECANVRGKTVCSNDDKAVGYNSRTGTVHKTETNESGVKTTESNRGGEAKTKNGVGVYQSPNGTTCVKTKENQGCK